MENEARTSIDPVSSAPVSSADVQTALRSFLPISLEDTNKSASMLKRIDNKYVVDKAKLRSILDQLRADFRVLNIDGRSVFSYESCYFDDRQRCFHEHVQGRRQRFKVRTRRYVESDKAFFEVKLKGKRGQTDKSREVCGDYYSFVIDDDQQHMLRKLYEQRYGKRFSYRLAPALHVSYRRFTLVSRSGRERITVDFNLGFETPTGRQAFIGDDFIIIETKTADGRGKSDRALKCQHVRSVNGCSKYCLGMVLTGEVERFNKFRSIARRALSCMQTARSAVSLAPQSLPQTPPAWMTSCAG